MSLTSERRQGGVLTGEKQRRSRRGIPSKSWDSFDAVNARGRADDESVQVWLGGNDMRLGATCGLGGVLGQAAAAGMARTARLERRCRQRFPESSTGRGPTSAGAGRHQARRRPRSGGTGRQGPLLANDQWFVKTRWRAEVRYPLFRPPDPVPCRTQQSEAAPIHRAEDLTFAARKPRRSDRVYPSDVLSRGVCHGGPTGLEL